MLWLEVEGGTVVEARAYGVDEGFGVHLAIGA